MKKMKIINLNYLFLLILINFAFKIKANNSTVWSLINQEDYSTVLPKPIDSTKSSLVDEKTNKTTNHLNNLTNFTFNIDNSNKSIINQQNLTTNISNEINELKIDQSFSDFYLNLNNKTSERTRTSKRLIDSNSKPIFGAKLKKVINTNLKNETTTNVDLHTNMTVISGRSAFDPSLPQSKSDSFFNSNDADNHLSAYDRIKIKNDKFSYDNFFDFFDSANENTDQDDSKPQTTSSKNPYEEENQTDQYQHLVQYRPANILPYTAQYQQQTLPPNYLLNDNVYPLQHAFPSFIPPSYSTYQKFKQYQRQRIKELLHRPVSQMFAGHKFKPDYVPKYMLEAPQRSYQQTGLGELFIVLGPLVILPLLSSFALSTFTTLYVTKSLIARPAASTASARNKMFASNGKLLKDDHLNSTLFNLTPPDELIYHPFNASDYDIHLLRNKSEHKSAREKKSKKDNTDPLESLKNESLKNLKRSKRSLKRDLIIKELGINSDDNKPRKRVRRWNEVLWTLKAKPKNFQTPWLPVTKKLTRQPRNSLFNKLYIHRPVKKVYKNLSKDLSRNQIKLKNINLTKIQNQMKENDSSNNYQNFNQPSTFLNFAINDAVASSKQLTNFEPKFDNFDRTLNSFDNFLNAASSSPSPTYMNFTTNSIDSLSNNFNNFNPTIFQPKLYNLKTNSASVNQQQQIIKRNSGSTNLFTPNITSKSPFNTLSMMSSNHQSNFNSASNFPIINSNDTLFQRISLLNPFHTPSFLKDHNQKKIVLDNDRTFSSSQNRTKNGRKLNLDNTKRDWDKELDVTLDEWNEEHDFTNKNFLKQKDVKDNQELSTLTSDLDVVQKYLKQTRPDGEYNDEIIATYLTCNGLLSQSNQCLQRLVCQYVDPDTKMPELEKEVASLIIYAILKNKYINDEFKQSMREAAQNAYQTSNCNQYQCLKINTQQPQKN